MSNLHNILGSLNLPPESLNDSIFLKCQRKWHLLRVEKFSFLYFIHFPKSFVPAKGSDE